MPQCLCAVCVGAFLLFFMLPVGHGIARLWSTCGACGHYMRGRWVCLLLCLTFDLSFRYFSGRVRRSKVRPGCQKTPLELCGREEGQQRWGGCKFRSCSTPGRQWGEPPLVWTWVKGNFCEHTECAAHWLFLDFRWTSGGQCMMDWKRWSLRHQMMLVWFWSGLSLPV